MKFFVHHHDGKCGFCESGQLVFRSLEQVEDYVETEEGAAIGMILE